MDAEKIQSADYYMSLNYPIELRAMSERWGGGYSACIPELGRWAFCADGETPEEALAHLTEVKRTLFEMFLKDGKSIPPPSRLPEEEPSTRVTAKEIIRGYLERHGYDGLYSEECGCEKSDLNPCDGPCSDCMPGYKIPCTCGNGCWWHIGPKKAVKESTNNER